MKENNQFNKYLCQLEFYVEKESMNVGKVRKFVIEAFHRMLQDVFYGSREHYRLKGLKIEIRHAPDEVNRFRKLRATDSEGKEFWIIRRISTEKAEYTCGTEASAEKLCSQLNNKIQNLGSMYVKSSHATQA